MPRSRKLSREEILGIIERASGRVTGLKDRKTLQKKLFQLIQNGALPAKSLENLPIPSEISGKTRIDQIYAICMSWAFPAYREKTLEVLNPEGSDPEIRLWKILLPKRFKVSNIVIKAKTYQEAFALGCDYACRSSIFMAGKIPSDLTVRVKYVTDSEAYSIGLLRKMNRKKFNSKNESPTRHRHISGVRICALGLKSNSEYSIFKYMENRDLKVILSKKGQFRTSVVDSENQICKSTKSRGKNSDDQNDR